MKVNKSKCLGCGACASMCPVNAIEMKGGKAEINKKKCIKCGTCLKVCPTKAIVIEEDSFKIDLTQMPAMESTIEINKEIKND